MAVSGRKCLECGRVVAMFTGLMVNGAAYHAICWDGRIKPVPKAPPAPRAATNGPTTAQG